MVIWLFVTLFFILIISFLILLVNSPEVVFKTVRNNFIYKVSNYCEHDWKLILCLRVCQDIWYDHPINFLLWRYPFWLTSLKADWHPIVQNQFTIKNSLRSICIFLDGDYQLNFVCGNVGLQINYGFENWLLLFGEVWSIFRILNGLEPKVFNSIFLFQHIFLLLFLIGSEELGRCIEVAFRE